MGFDKIIAQAAHRGRMVKLVVKGKGRKGSAEVEALELEPYSMKEKGGVLSFFCLHPETRLYLDIDLPSIIEAKMSDRPFKPRFPVAF